MDPTLIRHFRERPEVMARFDELAARHGQDIEAALVGDHDNPTYPPDAIVVGYPDHSPIAVIFADGTMEEMPR